jgi:hypothetical protein
MLTIPAPVTLTIRMRDQHGAWETDPDGGPVEITICGQSSAPTSLQLTGAAQPHRPYPPAVVREVAPLVLRVVDWRGFTWHRAPVHCVHELVLAALIAWPHMRRQVADAIRDFDSSGVG